jgi:elongation of very long chain fatty acids protein 6
VQFDNHWVALFCLSKIPELVDTVLLVLQVRPLVKDTVRCWNPKPLTISSQKKDVIFLHWYHHAVTLMYCWIAWVRCLNSILFPTAFL